MTRTSFAATTPCDLCGVPIRGEGPDAATARAQLAVEMRRHAAKCAGGAT